MGVSALGYAAQRLLGARLGLPLSGLAGGFVSSAATIGSMGARAAKHPTLRRAAAAGAVLSTVATIVQLALVLLATSRPVAERMRLPLLLGGAAAVAYGAVFALRLRRAPETERAPRGRAFDPKTSLLFAATVTAILIAAAAVHRWLGTTGLAVAVALAGFADAHAAAISAASLAAAGKIPPEAAVLPILLGVTANTVTKAIAASAVGGRRFALQTVPGLLLVLAGLWGGALLAGGIRADAIASFVPDAAGVSFVP